MNISIFPKINSLFILLGLFSALNEAANIRTSAVQKLKDDMPIYAAIYDLDDKWDATISANLENILRNQNSSAIDAYSPINLRPFLRSPLHRAIEKMNSGAVEWLVNKNAFLNYGLKETDPANWKLLDPKDRVDKPPHLIGHLEEYFDETNQDKVEAAKTIMEHLYSNGLDIGAWPVKNIAFRNARIEFFNAKGIDLDSLKDDESIKTKVNST